MPDLRALIFDLDGVLADTPMLHYQSWQRLATRMGVPFTWEQHIAMQGLRRYESLLIFLGREALTEAEAAPLMAEKNDYFLELIAQLTPTDCLPGVREVIEAGRAAGLRIGLGSSSGNARLVLERLGLRPLFDVVGDGHTVGNGKPAPDIFLWAAARLGAAPDECLVFEDSAAGVAAARQGGFWCVGLGGKHGAGAHIELASLHGVTLAALRERLDALAVLTQD